MEDFKTSSNNNSDKIIITKRQASIVTASFFVFLLSVFIVGYFLGKKSVLEDFSTKVTEESLNNQIDYLLTSQALESSDSENQKQQDSDQDILNDVDSVDIKKFAQDKKQQIVDKQSHDNDQNEKQSDHKKEKIKTDQSETKFYAQLVGFGTKRAALAFAARLKERDVSVVIKTRVSKTAKGKKRTWYQAVTPIMSDEKEFKKVIAKIQRLEHIRSSDIKTVHIKQK